MTLAEFLSARIAEDEKAALDRAPDAPIHAIGCYYFCNTYAPDEWRADHCDCEPEVKARALAECEAKRRIIEQAEEATTDRSQVIGEFCCSKAEADEARATDPGALILKALALPYADHPDYREEWSS